ncbi:hypothetical protein [Paracoccus actinidiae]|uniref:hypothetical protein n=1 Tax=Paracoccus actinidiae TaxID=3064531 RepID=UPI0027D2EEAB|nr:hypothetical protein [Paracoccus sp. M09]
MTAQHDDGSLFLRLPARWSETGGGAFSQYSPLHAEPVNNNVNFFVNNLERVAVLL